MLKLCFEVKCLWPFSQAKEAEAASQETRAKVAEYPEPQHEKYGHPQRGQADAHGGHGARDRR